MSDEMRNAEDEFAAEVEGSDTAAAPVETPAPAQAPEATPAAVDYAALEERAGKIREGTTLQNIVDTYAEQRSTLDRQTNQIKQLEQDYGSFKPMLEQIRKDPEYAKRLSETTNDYFSESETPSANPEVANVLDPVNQKLTKMEHEMASWRLTQQMDQLAQKYPQYVDDDMKAQIWSNVYETGNSDLEGIFSAMMLPKLAERATQATKTTERLIQNADGYTSPPDGNATATEQHSGDYTPDEVEAGIAEMLNE